MAEIWQTLRRLRRSPGFALSAACLLALGIAAATITFTFINALLLRTLPVPEPEKIFRLVEIRPRLGPRSYFSERFQQLLLRQATPFSTVSATYDFSTGYTDRGRTERVLASATSASFFTVFGTPPIIGSAFANDESAQAVPPVLLSYGFWQRRYGGTLDVIGRPVTIRGTAFKIAGVLPRGFNGTTIESGPDLRIPLDALRSFFPKSDESPWSNLELVGRLAPNVTPAAARSEAYRLYVNTSTTDDPPVAAGEFALEPVTRGVSRLRTQAGTAANFAMAGAAVLALMICVNLSGLLFARVIGRRREFAVRSALGASRLRLSMPMLAEAAVIVFAGAFLGALLTRLGVRWAAAQLPPVRLLDNTAVPMALDTNPDWRVFIFAIGLCLAAFLLLALVPAWKASRSDPDILRAGAGGGRTRGWKVLVAIQITLCTALLFGAAAVKATLENLRTADAGMARDRVICFTVDRDLSHADEANHFVRVVNEWRDKVKSLPGVQAAAVSAIRLLRGSGMKSTAAPAGEAVPLSDFMNTSMQFVGPEYFETLGQRVVEGRQYTAAEYQPGNSARIRPVVVNLAFARRFGKGTQLAGRQFGFGAGKAVAAQVEVVGVVSDAKYRSMREPAQPTIYSTISPESSRITLLVRTQVAPAGIAEPVRAALRSLAPDLLAEDVSTLEQDIEASLWTERALLWLSNAFAAIALTVAGAGLGGLMVFLVAARTREIAIRVAIGAAPRDIWTLVMGDGVPPVLAGLAAGCGAGFVLVRTAESLLYGVSVRDPRLAVVAAAGVGLAALAASLIPTVRALRVDPALALREE